ncbi:RDD family protein [Streptacidiphilus jiangxiensis]|uniref:RDD family protein n=1 Tax=Streptacidiphilus jiangxiensis TaxID=235985 RepID=UPI0013774009|nr:RDD family protein [Streptacidiphilus jiangxiensis]
MTEDAQFARGPEQSGFPLPVTTLAGFGARLGASLIDAVILAVPMLVLLVVGRGPLASGGLVQTVLGQAMSIVYGGALVAGYGRTVGMRALNIRVVPLDPSAELTSGQAWLRAVAFNLPSVLPVVGVFWVFVDCLWMLWDKPNSQTLHDKIARTVVVTTVPSLAAG